MNDTIEKGQKVSVFDDVFKTICHKMPQLLIPVVNEAFGTNYDPKTPIRRLGTEQHEKYGKRNQKMISSRKICYCFCHITYLGMKKQCQLLRIKKNCRNWQMI